MNSDRRTIMIGIVLVAFVILSAQTRSIFVYGARLCSHQFSLNGTSWISTIDDDNVLNLGAWSIDPVLNRSGPTRDERLGLAIVQSTAVNQGVGAIEDFCKANPDDIPAQAHLLRLAISVKVLPKGSAHKSLAERLETIAAVRASQEPDNWFWRERSFRILTLLGKSDQAISVLTATPFPTKFDDFVADDMKCIQALHQGQNPDLPKSAYFPIWSMTTYPHLSAYTHIDDLIRTNPQNLRIRIAQMELGRAMVKSGTSAIAVAIGLRNVRHGLWVSRPKVVMTWKDFSNESEQARIESPYKSLVSAKAWDTCLNIGRSDPRLQAFYQVDDMSPLIYGYQLGPILIFSGISNCLFGLVLFLLNRTSIPEVNFQKLALPTLLIGLSLLGSTWQEWRYLANFSLGGFFTTIVVIALACFALFRTKRWEKSDRWFHSTLIIAALGLGLAYRGWQASSSIFLIVYLLQTGKFPLKPWTLAVSGFLLSYHVGINLAFSQAPSGYLLSLGLGLATLAAFSKRPLDPDQVRIAPITLGIVSLVIGIFLFTQYDKSITTVLENDQVVSNQIRAKYANY